MVHDRQGLPLGFEAGDNRARIHARLEDLEGHLAADGLHLLGHEHDAEAPLADLLEEFVGADDGPRAFGDRVVNGHDRAFGGFLQKAAGLILSGQHFLDAPAKLGITGAGFVEISRALLRRPLLQGGEEDGLEWRRIVHENLPHLVWPCADSEPALVSVESSPAIGGPWPGTGDKSRRIASRARALPTAGPGLSLPPGLRTRAE